MREIVYFLFPSNVGGVRKRQVVNEGLGWGGDSLPESHLVSRAEKAMISRNEQYSPMHRHNIKAEDIINRGGGTLVIELYGDTGGKCDKTKGVEVCCDGIRHKLPPGGKLRLKPGESVTLMPNEHWHAFWAEGGDVFIGEVSTVNNDTTDNVFDDPDSAIGGIEEDEEPWHLLVSDYKKWL